MQADWNKLSEEERFYSTAENKAKECYITFTQPVPEGESAEDSVKASLQEIQLDLQQLKDLEN